VWQPPGRPQVISMTLGIEQTMSYYVLSTLHIASAIVAIVAGLVILLTKKGTRRHRQISYCYVTTMLILNLTALSIYRLTGRFGPFHYAAVLSMLPC
jgi:uncharacterized membrane protein